MARRSVPTVNEHRKAQRAAALSRFEAAVELPLLILAVAMIPLIVVPLVVDLPERTEDVLEAVDWFIWAAFAFEYLVRLALTEKRLRFVVREWPALLIILLPFLRMFRIVRSARALRLLSLTRLIGVLGKLDQEVKRLLVRHRLHYAILVTLIVVVGSAALVLAVEDGHGGAIDSFGDALWWAVTTVTTVGYGDTFPITPAGRGVAALLMVAGITLFGFLTANLAAFLLEHGPAEDAEQDEEPQPTNAELLARIDALAQEVQALRLGRQDAPPVA